MGSSSDTEKALFHYTRSSTALEKILTSMTLRMGPLEATNDPMETNRMHVRLLDKRDRSPEELDRFLADSIVLQKTTMASCRVVCLTHEDPVIVQSIPDDVRFDIGLPGFAHDRMWGQYADGHRGVCLFFPKDKLTKAIEAHFATGSDQGKLLHGPVQYFARVPRIGSFTHDIVQKYGIPHVAQVLRDLYADRLFFSKSFDWIGEQEYRYVWIDNTHDFSRSSADLVSIRNCLGGICLGRRFPSESESTIRSVAADLGVPVYRMGEDNGIPVLWELLEPHKPKER